MATKRVGELITVRVRTGSGAWVYLELRGTHPVDDDTADGTIVVVARDVTDRHRLDFDQGDTGVLRAVMANMHGMVVLVDGNGLIRSINGAGHPTPRLRPRADPRPIDLRLPAPRRPRARPRRRARRAAARFDHARRPAPDGRLQRARREITCEFTVNNLLDDPVVHSYVISAQIATALADARNRVNFLAEHDSRTGLLNRDGFMRNAEELDRSTVAGWAS